MMKKKNIFARIAASFLGMFKRQFVREKLSVLDEEALTTPLKQAVKNFFRNRLGVIGLVLFTAFLLFAFLGSALFPLVETYTELPNANLKPGTNYLSYPKDLDVAALRKIASGISFSVALTEDGQMTVWGTEPNQKMENVSDPVLSVPAELREKHITNIATGGQHVLAVDDQGDLYGWGYYGQGQTLIPEDVIAEMEETGAKVDQLAAASMWSAIVTSDKNLYIWGSTQATMNFRLTRDIRGHVEKIAAGDNNMVVLLDDGTLRVVGERSSEMYNNLPPELKDGTVRVVDIAASNRNALVLDDRGNIYTWGSAMDGLLVVPAYEGEIAAIGAGYRHFNLLMEDGSVVTWGSNALKQTTLPGDLPPLTRVFSDYYQNYGVGEDGKLYAWGNKGYTFGTDEYGRDMLLRLIHGGRISLTVGAIAMVISTLIALVVGLTAGYFGGWVDHALMRLADVFSAIPFYPIAVTLSYIIGGSLPDSARLYLIMVIMGVLGWMGLARMIRAQLLVEREKDFVLAARALGIRRGKIMWRHILPNVLNLVIVTVTLGYASSLLSEAALSFLGFGVAPPAPSWGNMLTAAQQSTVIQFYWWRWFIPGLFVVLAALSANLIGDALREATDPRGNER